MESIELKGTLRTSLGKSSSKKLRSDENVPCVVYGGKEIIHFSTAEKNFKSLIYTPNVYLVKLDVDGKIHECVLQDVQFHPVSDRIIHVDFLEVDEKKPVVVSVPINIHGTAAGVKEGGKLLQELRKLKIKGLTKDIPHEVDIDVTNLGIAHSIKVSDLNYPNIELLDLKTTCIVSVRMTRATKDETAAPAEGAPAEAAAAAPAAGKEAPADKGSAKK
ncbi:MAG: 50S ribosomal protein L25/general stress protein Ctc [Bacteroidota bacterium]|nr:50S ribosomal protein L25/general stress protein Ctc [Bacteroidota bacterium]MDP4227622.1 50S ribosomal protein L25/general stress protein Ctc [Bacteroidota bacterium]